MKTLYCYRYNEETGELKKYVIEDYEIIENKYTGNKTYKFRKRLGTITLTTTYLHENQLNRYTWNKVFMFEDNKEKAEKIIENELYRRKRKLERDVEKAQEKMQIFWKYKDGE